MIYVVKCPVCGKLCKNKGGLTLHMMYRHPDEVESAGIKVKKSYSDNIICCPECHSRDVRELNPFKPDEKAMIREGYRLVCNRCQEVFNDASIAS